MDTINSSSNIKENFRLKENISNSTISQTTSYHTPSFHYTSYSSNELAENRVSINQVIVDDWGQYIDIETNQLFSNIS